MNNTQQKRLTILHIDDDREFLEIFCFTFKKYFEITSVLTAEEAFKLLKQSRFDVIVCDYKLEDADGVEFLRKIRKNYPNIPFILFTGHGNEQVARDSLKQGAADYFSKNITDLIIKEKFINSVIKAYEKSKDEETATNYQSNLEALIKERTEQCIQVNKKLTEELQQRQNVEKALLASEEKYRTLFEAAPVGIVITDLASRIIDLNQKAVEICSLPSKEAVIGNFTFNFFVPEDLTKALEDYYKALSGDIKESYEYKLFRKNGEVFYIQYKMAFIPPGKPPEMVIFMFRNITEQKLLELKLQDTEEKILRLLRKSFDGVIIYNDREILETDEAVYKEFGMIKEEFEAESVNIANMILPESLNMLKKIMEDDINTFFKVKGYRKNGRIFCCEALSAKINYKGQKATVTAFRDITEKENALKELENFKKMINCANFGFGVSNLQGKIIYINDYMAEVHGYKAEELIGKSYTVFFSEKYKKDMIGVNEEIFKPGGFKNLEVMHLHRDGSVFPMLMNGAVIKDETEQKTFLVFSAVKM